MHLEKIGIKEKYNKKKPQRTLFKSMSISSYTVKHAMRLKNAIETNRTFVKEHITETPYFSHATKSSEHARDKSSFSICHGTGSFRWILVCTGDSSLKQTTLLTPNLLSPPQKKKKKKKKKKKQEKKQTNKQTKNPPKTTRNNFKKSIDCSAVSNYFGYVLIEFFKPDDFT